MHARTLTTALITAATALSTTACASAQAEAPTPEETFADVLADPGAIPVNEAAHYAPTGTYSYTFTDFNADGIQDMLLRVDSEGKSPVVPIRATGDGGYVPAKQVILDGDGGYADYTDVLVSTSGDGVYERNFEPYHRDHIAKHWKVEGDTLVDAGETVYPMDTELPGTEEATWLNTATGEPVDHDHPSRPAEPVKPVLHGTLKRMSDEELMQGKPVPEGRAAAGDQNVLVLDTPIPLTGQTDAGETVTRDAWVVLFGRETDAAADWEALRDKRVSVTYEPGNLYFHEREIVPPDQPKVHGNIEVNPE